MSGLTPVELELWRHALAGVAEEMGVALRRAAYSPNIKERADCSAPCSHRTARWSPRPNTSPCTWVPCRPR